MTHHADNYESLEQSDVIIYARRLGEIKIVDFEHGMFHLSNGDY